MGAGGASGAVSFPPYIEELHQLFLWGQTGLPTGTDWQFSLNDIFNAALDTGGNPFEGYTLYDPDNVNDYQEVDAHLSLFEAKYLAMVLDPNDLLDDFMDKIGPMIDTEALYRPVDVRKAAGTAGTLGMERVHQFLEEFEHGISPETDWGSFVDVVVSKLDKAGVLLTVDPDEVVSDALAAAEAAFTAIISAASAAMDDPNIAQAVEAFETRIQNAKGRAVRDFSAGMADINAVHTSAFVFGRALIESDVLADIARFESELHSRIYTAALQSFGGTHGGIVRAFLEAQSGNVRARDQLLNTGVGALIGLVRERTSFSQAAGTLFVQAFLGELGERIRGEAINAQLASGALDKGLERLFSYNQYNLTSAEMLAKLYAEIKKQKAVAYSEYDDRFVDLAEKHAMWPFEIFTRSMNLLAAPSGMGAVVPPRPSRVQSGLAGMSSIMGAAGAIPGIGAPAAIGAGLLGGLAGLLG